MSNFTATVSATSGEEAVGKVQRRLLAKGFSITGKFQVRSERHMLWDVEVVATRHATKADRDAAWVQLTSYGISPSEDLGSYWQKVGL